MVTGSSLAAAWRGGTLPVGPRGTIADVPGVTVGHCTLDDGPVQTGVTVAVSYTHLTLPTTR